MKTVSVIIPNYNNARYLGRAIQSVLRQTFGDYEVIVVDDGSTDDSKDVLSTFPDKVRYIWHENKGLGGARNTGILASQAEFIGLLDADDEWRPMFLERMMSLIQRYPDAAVYYGAAQAMDALGQDLPQIFGRMLSSGDIYRNLLRTNHIIPSTVLLRRAIIIEAGLFEERNRSFHGCEDWDLWLRLSPSHQLVATDEVVARYRLHPNTFSRNASHMQAAVRSVVEKHFGLDDGRYQEWSSEKRRAFGGVYRYQTLTSVQREGGWAIAAQALPKALAIDPTLAVDLNLFYELAFGCQPPGYRETAYHLELEQNGRLIMNLLGDTFSTTEDPMMVSLRRRTFATANYAIGLVAYNINRKALCKRFLCRALMFRPGLLFDRRLIQTLTKSYLPPSVFHQLKRYRKSRTHA